MASFSSFVKLLVFSALLSFSLIAKPLKIASWNVENLFDAQRQGTEYEEYIPGRHGWGEEMLRKKLLNLSEVICDLDADVIALQEVENDQVLARLQQTLRRLGCRYPYRAITTGPGRPIHVALLSKVRIARKREIPVSRFGRERRILELTLDTKPPLKLFVNHWRSKRAPESERIRYAKALRRRLERLPAGSEYLLLGDFNSDYREYRVIEPRHNDTGGITGINQILGTVDERGRMIRLEDLGKKGSGLRHLNLWMELESSRRWSHNFFGKLSAIDSILIPSSLADGRGWEYRPGSFGVYRPDYLFGRRGEIRRWAYRHGKHQGKGYSDHLPIFAEFERLEGSSASSPPVKTPQKQRVKKVDISYLLAKERLEAPVALDDAVVVFRRGRHGVIQQYPDGPAILIYGAASGLEEGRSYDLGIHGLKRYRGMPEITDLEIDGVGPRRDLSDYIPLFRPEMMDQKRWRYRVVRGIEGVYGDRKIRVGGRWIPLHFKKRSWIPEKGAHLRIKRAQIGYYKDHTELVVWDRSDFETVRK